VVASQLGESELQGRHLRGAPANEALDCAIDVCRNRSLDACNANDDSKWVPLEEWLNLEQEEE
jgi:hypothetical protein